jgi:hypothetical protein
VDNVAGHSTIGNNVIGFQPAGDAPGANGAGIFISNSPSNFIAYNFVGYNTSEGILIAGPSAAANLLEFNTVGSDRTFAPAGNVGAGITLSFGTHDNTIGAAATSVYGGNAVANNQGPGIWLTPSAGTGNRILANTMSANSGLAVDLGNLGATANDADDADSGSNNLQNYPVIVRANRSAPGYAIVGTLRSTPMTIFRLEFYRADCSAIGAPARGSMSEFLGHDDVTTDANGLNQFSAVLAYLPDATLKGIAATATDAAGNTSEIGNCVLEGDRIFQDGFN